MTAAYQETFVVISRRGHVDRQARIRKVALGRSAFVSQRHGARLLGSLLHDCTISASKTAAEFGQKL